jgi:endonuclease G
MVFSAELNTGPVFGTHPQQLNGRVSIPAQIYKLVYDPAANRAWAYWTDNTDDACSAAPISYQELTKRIGVELLPGIHIGA